MKLIKGCGNDLCEAHKRKLTYKDTENFCSKCGKTLVYVCKDCYTQLPNNVEKYCVRCYAKHEDRKDKTKEIAARIGSGTLIVGIAILRKSKKAAEFLSKVKF